MACSYSAAWRSRLAAKVTGGACSSKLTPAGSWPLAIRSSCWRRNWRTSATPLSLSVRCSSECKVIAPWPVCASKSPGNCRCSGRQLLPQLAALARAHAAQLAFLAHAAGDIDAEVRVVDRQGPADRLDAPEQVGATTP